MWASAITLLFLLAQQPERTDSSARNEGQLVTLGLGTQQLKVLLVRIDRLPRRAIRSRKKRFSILRTTISMLSQRPRTTIFSST